MSLRCTTAAAAAVFASEVNEDAHMNRFKSFEILEAISSTW